MATGEGTVIELRLEADGLSGRIACPPGLLPAAGQYITASGPDPTEPLPLVIFPTQVESEALRAPAPLPATWSAGTRLALRGPLGRGFQLPLTARRVALASLDGNPACLLPLADLALSRRAAVAIYANIIPAGLPEEVEVLPVDLLPEAPAWADFLALAARPADTPRLRARLGLKPFQHPACTTQVLVVAPMPCGGLAECGVCSVSTRKGWLQTCTDGPVFDYGQLEEG